VEISIRNHIALGDALRIEFAQYPFDLRLFGSMSRPFVLRRFFGHMSGWRTHARLFLGHLMRISGLPYSIPSEPYTKQGMKLSRWCEIRFEI
jgi:pyruvate/2-oxoglutarate/acetoin dehydrogenase E1 component